jgi:cell division septal protein FtsQ
MTEPRDPAPTVAGSQPGGELRRAVAPGPRQKPVPPRDPVSEPKAPGPVREPRESTPPSEPKARGAVWTEEPRAKRAGDEGRQHLEARRRQAGSSNRSRRSRRYRAAFFALAMTGVVAAVVWALLGSRLLVVRSVAVTGTNLVPVSAVLQAAGVTPGTPMVRVNTAQVATRVEAIRQVQSVQVVKSWPDRIVIEVRERDSAVAVPAAGGGFDLVDAYGVVVRWAASRPARFPLFQTSQPATSLRGNQSVALAAAVLGELPAPMRSSVKSVSVPYDQVTLAMADGQTVVWGGADRSAAKVQVLAILMRTHARYYNISAPGVAMTEG